MKKSYSKIFITLFALTAAYTNVFAQLAGTKTIGGTSPDYATLSDAVTALNSNGVGSGGVTFNIRDGAQAGNVTITATGTAANPIVFQSENLDASLVIISSSSNADIITLTGCSYITFNELTIDYTGSYSYSVFEIQNNSDNVTIQNCILDGSSSTTSSSTASVIYASESSSSDDCDNFVAQDCEISNGSIGVYFDMSSSQPGGFKVEGCELIDNLTSGVYARDIGAPIITGNSIHRSLNSSNTFFGIYLNNCDGQSQVTQNYIYTVGSGEIAYGISLNGSSSSSGNNATCANNSIQLENGGSSAYGIDQNSASEYWNIYSNTIYITGGSSSSSSYCYRSFTSTDDTKIQNNVFCHAGTSTGSSANQTIYIGNSSGVGSIDYNCYYTENTGNPFRGRWPSTNYTDFSSWTSATGESNSVNIDPEMLFVAGVGWKATANALTGDGTNLGLTQDVDGNNRQSPTTIGAHENGAGTSPNIIVSVTSLNQFITAVGTPSATQTYTVEGENLTANLIINAPTHWQIKQQGVGVFGSSVSLTPSSGTVAPTTIEARYNPSVAGTHSGNITHNSTGASERTVAVNGVSTWCTGSFAGTYTINPSSPANCNNYHTFADVVSDMVSGTRTDAPDYFHGPGIDGAVTFNVSAGTYTEQISIDEITGVSSTNTVTFKSQSGNNTSVTLTYPGSNSIGNNYTLDLNGADYVTFRDMSIKRSGSNTYAHVIEMHGDASNNHFINNVIEGRTGSSAENAALVWAGDDNAANSDNFFEDNHFMNGAAGIWYEGSFSNRKGNLSITGNLFECYRYGIYLQYIDGTTINDNRIVNASSFNSASTQGIYAFHLDDALSIQRNEIYLNRGTNVIGMELRSCEGDGSTFGTIANNMVAVGSSQSESSSGAGNGTGTTEGIYMNGTTHKNFYFNSWLSTSSNPTTARAFYVNGPSNANINLRNNIFAASNGGYAFYNSVSSAISSSNYNDFYAPGSSYYAHWGSSATSLSALQSNSGMDANSVDADPVFTSNVDLHAAGNGVDGYGTPAGSITVDIDGDTRDASTPDIGADEITTCTSPTVDTDPSGSTICENTNTTFSVVASGTNPSYQWQVNTGSGFVNVTNTGVYSGATTDELTITGATAGMDSYVYKCVVSGDCTPNDTSATATLTVNGVPTVTADPSPSSIGAGANTSFSVTATGAGLTYQWQVNTGNGFTNLGNGGVYSGVSTNTLNITGATLGMNGYTYRCVVSGTCTPSATSNSALLTVLNLGLTWNGSLSTNWFTSQNWTPNQVPTNSDDITIPDVANDPVITTNGATCRDMSIASGATLTINSGLTLAVNGDISANGNTVLGSGTVSIQTSGNSTLTGSLRINGVISVATGATLVTNNGLTLENGASLMHGTGTPGAGGSVSGNITVRRNGSTSSSVFNMWSTPVASAVVPGGDVYQYISANGTHSTTDDNPGPDPGWASYSGNMVVAKGYISTNGGNASFFGAPNDGNKTISVTTSSHPLNSLLQGSKFNLVGNPYPSAISANNLTSGNSGVITSSLYFWDDDLSGGGGYSAADFAVWNGTGSVGGGGHTPNGSIGSCQGFYVEASSSGNVSFANSMRGTNNSQFFRLASPQQDLKVWVSFEKDNLYNEVLVGFLSDATETRSEQYDAYKISALTEMSLSLVKGTDEFAIAAFPDNTLGRVVPLHLRLDADGTGVFKLARTENLNNNQVFLYDDYLNVMHNITADTSYATSVTVADAFDRFFLYFNPTITDVEEHEGSVSAHYWNNKLFVTSNDADERDVVLTVYDILGKQVFSRQGVDLSLGNNVFDLNGLSTGAYVVNVSGTIIYSSEKILVK